MKIHTISNRTARRRIGQARRRAHVREYVAQRALIRGLEGQLSQQRATLDEDCGDPSCPVHGNQPHRTLQ
jgi:hypothetical protein